MNRSKVARSVVTHPYLWLIEVIGIIVPRRLRADWKQEWEAELVYREDLLAKWDRLDWRTKLDLLRRSMGGFWDALRLQPRRLEDEMLLDLRYGARMLLKNKMFTSVAVFSLALGIGANTALFSLVDAVLLKLLPVKAPEQLVLFRWVSGEHMMMRSFSGSLDKDDATGLSSSTSFSYPAFEQLREDNQMLSDVFAFAQLEQVNVNVDGNAEIAGGQLVTGGYFAGLGLPAMLGRALDDDDDRAGAAPAVMLSYNYWRRRFGANPEAVGKVVYLNGAPFTVAGVTPPEFYGTMDFGVAPDVLVPMAFQPQVLPTRGRAVLQDATNFWIHIMGRLPTGTSREQALANLDLALQKHAVALQRDFQDKRDVPHLRLESGSQGLAEVQREQSGPLTVLMCAVGLVLMIACINVANLLLARAAARQKEIAVRLAVGASRLRLIRQLLTESLLLAALGGALGLLFAYWGKDAVQALMDSGRDTLTITPQLDFRVLAFTAGLTTLTGILFGLAPALRATRFELTPMLKEGAGGSGIQVRSRLSKTLIVIQVALSFLLLIGAGLFVRTLSNLTRVDVGFNRANLLIFRVQPRMSGYEGERLRQVYQQMIERIEAVPGVRAATVSRHPLLSGSMASDSINVPGYTPQPGESSSVMLQQAGANFFATMELPLLIGRDFSTQDNAQSAPVVVINQALARRYFANENPLGKHIYLGKFNPTGQSGQDKPIEIIGIAGDAKYDSLRSEVKPTAYVPYLQANSPPVQMNFAVRTAADPAAATENIRQAVRALDPNLPLFAVKTQQAQIAELAAQARLFATLSSFFGLLALALAGVGLYGVMSHNVARRTHEIGIRVALGAQNFDVLSLILRQGAQLALIGIGIGLLAAWQVTRLLRKLLYGVSATDPLTFMGVGLLLIGVALLACYLPARRASKVDPLVALRHE